MPKHYLLVVAPGPLMILRVPWPMPRWRSVLRATTAVMRAHGLRQKDVHALDGLMGPPDERDEEDRAYATRIDAAYDGATGTVPKFLLYDWHGDAFKLARAATEAA
jgi:hypothetical protein